MYKSWAPRGLRVGPRRAGFLAGALLLVAALLLAGCDNDNRPATPLASLRLDIPAVFYVSKDPADIGTATNDLRLIETPGSAVDFRISLDTRDLAGTAVLKTGLDACPVRPGAFHCDVSATRHNPGIQIFHLVPAKGARPGDSAVLRYTLTAEGAAPVTRRTVVTVGRPTLAVGGGFASARVRPGESTAASVIVRNSGDVPARGVVLRIEVRDGAALADRHRNCRYRGGGSAVCRIPADEVVIPPDASYRFAVPERVRTDHDGLYPTAGFEAYATGTDPGTPSTIARQYRRGGGPGLRLVPATPKEARESVGSPADRNGQHGALLTVPVLNTADLAAVSGTVRGPVGSRGKLRVGVRNNGPGSLPGTGVAVTFAVPEGTTVVSSPYAFENDEEMIDQPCRAVTADGTPLTAEPSEKQPRARRYVCAARAGEAGSTATFPFTLRIDDARKDRGGGVTVEDKDKAHGSNDTALANNTADVDIQVWPGPSWATPGTYATTAVLTALTAAALLLRRHRHRRRRRAATYT